MSHILCSVCGGPVDPADWSAAPVWTDPDGHSATAHPWCFEHISEAFDAVFSWENGL